MDAPLISIIIPTYNRAKLLQKAIQSVLDQTYQNWELIIIDNYSDDGTKELIESYQDHRIKMHVIPRTGSVAASRNFGVHISRGEWVAFLDSDDWWFSEKLLTVNNFLGSESDLIYHDLKFADSNGSLLEQKKNKSRKLKQPIYFDLLLNGNAISMSSVVVRKSVFQLVNGMNESSRYFAIEDYDTWIRIAQITESFLFIPKILGAYRVHEGNIGKINNFKYLSDALEIHLSQLSIKQLRRYQSLYIYQIARINFLNQKFKVAISPLIFVSRFGRTEFKIKSAYMLIRIVSKKIRPSWKDFDTKFLLDSLLR